MAFGLNRIGQIALGVQDVDRAEAFYRDTLGLRALYRFGDLTFFDCCGVRLLLEKTRDPENVRFGSTTYFDCHDIALAVRELRQRGVSFSGRHTFLHKWTTMICGWRSLKIPTVMCSL